MRIDTGWGEERPTYIHATPVGRGAALTQGQIDDGWQGGDEGEGASGDDARGDMTAALTFLAVVFMVGVLCGVVLALGLVGRV